MTIAFKNVPFKKIVTFLQNYQSDDKAYLLKACD